ncbi:energy-coupling factor ABC transporter ATP-binding protein [Propionicicella superfundia]|uniref:energy-coupling factor ABC transporter ATP-binding protein n=1 Tax=Propionicicella superfundia TaxID=348582 RepID=UPI0004175262|nr:energy-coupling factor ABC transporter ATP-binding protein [Propionicicella superfundia]
MTATIELQDAAVRVPDDDLLILEPTSLRLTERRIGVIGGNGSGKSTLVRLFNGLTTATTGRVLVDGLDPAKDPAAVRRRVGFCFTDPAAQLIMPTCVEDVELSLRRGLPDPARRRAAALDILAEFGLADRARTSVHALSGGQRQLLALAGVLATRPAVVVADEPTTLLDLANSRRVAQRLFELEPQLVLVSHDLDLVRRCDRVLVVDHARVVFDGPAEAAVEHYTELALAEAAS